jgi:hypothetical protein
MFVREQKPGDVELAQQTQSGVQHEVAKPRRLEAAP